MALAKLSDGELIQDEKDLLYAIEKHMGRDVMRVVEDIVDEKQDEIEYLEKEIKELEDKIKALENDD